MLTEKLIDPQAVELFVKVGWVWNGRLNAFEETRTVGLESTEDYRGRKHRSIDYDALRDHDLVGATSDLKRDGGLIWLRRQLGLKQ